MFCLPYNTGKQFSLRWNNWTKMDADYHSSNTLIVLFICVGYFSSSSSFTAALPRNTSIVVPGGSRPWYCCHLRAWLNRASKRDGGTTDTSPDKAENTEKWKLWYCSHKECFIFYLLKTKSPYRESLFRKINYDSVLHVEVWHGMFNSFYQFLT